MEPDSGVTVIVMESFAPEAGVVVAAESAVNVASRDEGPGHALSKL